MARMNQSVRCVICAETMELRCLAEHISHHVGYSPYKCRQCPFATPFYAEALLHCEQGNGHVHQYRSDEKIQVAVQALFSRCLDEQPTGGALLGQLKQEFEESVKKEEEPVPKEKEQVAAVIADRAPLAKPQERPDAERSLKASQKPRNVPAKEAVPNPPNTPRIVPQQSPLRRQSHQREERGGMSPLRSQSRQREEMLHRSVMKKRSATRKPSPTRHSSGKAPRLNLDEGEGSSGGRSKVETIRQGESSVKPSYYSDWPDYSDWTWSAK